MGGGPTSLLLGLLIPLALFAWMPWLWLMIIATKQHGPRVLWAVATAPLLVIGPAMLAQVAFSFCEVYLGCS